MDETSATSGTYTVVATNLLLRRWWYLPRFFRLSWAVQKQLATVSGLVTYRLKANFFKLQFSTLSVWSSPQDVGRFAGSGAHTRAMEAFPNIAKPSSSFIRWTTNDPDSVTWQDAFQRLGI